jgi:ORF6N domain-containing protein
MADRDLQDPAREVIAAPAIEKRIYVIRGRQVMLDEDLADLYGVETKRLVEQVKRNLERFPGDFMFQLRKDEAAALRSQIATSNTGRGGRRYAPYVFYGAGRGHALLGLAEQDGHRREHRDHAGVCRAAPSRQLLRGGEADPGRPGPPGDAG